MRRRSHTPVLALAFALALVPYAWLVARFDYLSDDAYINFTYAKHLAAGMGLRFNPGDHQPVEAYNALWTLLMSIPEWFGWNTPFVSKLCTVASGTLLLLYVLFVVRVRFGASALTTVLTGLFLATLPSFAMWSTSGMEQMPTVLLVFATYERLLGDPERPRGWQAGVCAALAGAMRPDGVPLAASVIAAGACFWLLTRHKALLGALVRSAAVLSLYLVAHTAFRKLYHGDWVPNTVRVKGQLDATTLERGWDYFVTLMLSYPGLLVVLAAGVWTLRLGWHKRGLQMVLLLAAYLGYCVLVGGDFMPMGRFLLVSLPFIALVLARVLCTWRSSPASLALTATAIALTLPAAFDRHVVPLGVRESFNFRWAQPYVSEYQAWAIQRDNTERWIREGKALARFTRPGESLIRGPIGAVGYHTELYLHDLFGLTDRDVLRREPSKRRLTAGHTRLVDADWFLPRKPDLRHMQLLRVVDDPRNLLTIDSPALEQDRLTRFEMHLLRGTPGFEDDEGLLLQRLVPLDADFDMLRPVIDACDGIDLFHPEVAEAELTERLHPSSPMGERIARRAGDLLSAKPKPAQAHDSAVSTDFSGRIDVWWRNGPVLPRIDRRGAIHLCLAVAGSPTIDGRSPGWIVTPPGHGPWAPEVRGGVVVFVSLQP
jgi:hypothetical protein